MKKKLQVILMTLLTLVVVACTSGKQPSTTQEKPKVMTTFYPVYYMTKEIAGKNADVKMLLNGSVEAHDYEPTAKDIAAISEAKLFVYSSKEMETWVDTVEEGLKGSSQVAFVASGEKVDFLGQDEQDQEHEEHEDHEGHEKEHRHEVDPHIWLEPSIAKQQVESIAQALIAMDKEHESDYTANKEKLLAKLDELAKEYKEAFEGASNKVFATQHTAFGYIAHIYGLKQIAVSGLQATEPTPKAVAQVVEEIKEHQLSTIYVEPSSSTAVADTVSKETGVSIAHLYTLETQPEKLDYLQALKANLEALKLTIK